MGLFDVFKKKETTKEKEINPLLGDLLEANLSIENLQVTGDTGTVTVTGTAYDGETVSKALEILKEKGVTSVTNKMNLANLSHLGVKYKLATNGKNLNCRKGPSKDDAIVGKFPPNATVNLIQKHSAKWHKVSGDGIVGYCLTDYLKPVKKS